MGLFAGGLGSRPVVVISREEERAKIAQAEAARQRWYQEADDYNLRYKSASQILNEQIASQNALNAFLGARTKFPKPSPFTRRRLQKVGAVALVSGLRR